MIEEIPGIYFIRHGTTEWNWLHMKSKEEPGNYSLDKFGMDLLDSNLHEEGREQAIQKQSWAAKYKATYVFTSPLRRALETTYLLFKEHPNRQNINIIVHPLIVEKMKYNHDFPRDFVATRAEYEAKEELKFDFSLFDTYLHPSIYYLYELNEPFSSQLLSQIIPTQESGKFRDLEVILKLIYERSPEPLETSLNCVKRGRKFCDYLDAFMKKMEITEKIFVISHSQFLLHLSAKYFEEGSGKPLDGKWCQNLDYLEFTLDQLPKS